MPATGRSAAFDSIEIVGVRDGTITDHWSQIDATGLMTQLGLMGEPATEG
jgi:predicted ester cyclase